VSRDWVQQRIGGGRRPGGSRRRVVAQAFAADSDVEPPAQLSVFRRAVLVELVGAVVVLVLSAVLVSQVPAEASMATPVDVTVPLQSAAGTAGTGSVQLTVDPARPGATTVHVYLLDAEDRLVQPRQIAVTLTELAQEIGPLDLDLAPAGPGHYIAEPSFPAAGSWTLTVTVRLDEFTAVTASTVFPVR
jgi:copper transport protein